MFGERDSHARLLDITGKEDNIEKSTLYVGVKVSPEAELGVVLPSQVRPSNRMVFEKEMRLPPQAQFLSQNVPTKTDLSQKPQTSFYT